MSSSCIAILVLIFSIFLSITPSSARTPRKSFRPRALVLPVTKDPSTNQYLTTISQRTPLKPVKLTLDVGGKALWVACDRAEYNSSTYRPALCRSPQCKLAKAKSCGNCWDGPRPGCTNNTCTNVVYNTVDKSGQIGDLATDVVALRSTDGSNPGPIVRVPNLLFSCGSLFLGEELAKGAKGIAGFGKTETSIPSLLSNALGIPKKFAICLSSLKGVVFIGNGPYVMLPSVTVSDRLVYTPLLTNPVSTVHPIIDKFPDKSWPSMEYFIGVESARVNGKTVPLSPKSLKIDAKGNGGTKISTVEPYTVLQTSIYNAITKAFTKAISKVPRVGPVGPFSTCYKSSVLGSTRLGPGVPPIELVLENNVTWTIFGANSMVTVNKGDVACLAFVDGGKKPRTSIVIGGHQLEDNLLEFDVEKSRLGFSSTLLGRQTTCANFNFTAKA
ncbi:basic 7s globulin [Phtheirospermum japonicum]|uniref:Basic 7s globulin n=1 Tax=Phtheirospermum japonicum TaxID=374723 RepID=A0A830BIR2_9LAMI|nr:basic 7s globulin [Phtheirospermum japonicum]